MKKHLSIICTGCILFIFCIKAGAQNHPDTLKHTPQMATIGLHIMHLYQVDLSSNSFYADFYLWCRWKGSIDPLQDIEFTNSQEEWGFSKTLLYDSAVTVKDGFLYNILHVQGKFHHTFVLNNYPVDKQTIKIAVENSAYISQELQYVADTVNSSMQPDLEIPGWKMEGFKLSSSEDVYKTNFGLPEKADNDDFSHLSFAITMHRPLQYFLLKLLLPIIIVLLSGLGATLIFPGYTDARIYAPVGALLTIVFLQQSSSSALPDISYLVLTDKIYVIAYIVILIGIFQAIVTANLVKDGAAQSFKKAKRLDRIYLISIAAFLMVSTVVLIFQAYKG